MLRWQSPEASKIQKIKSACTSKSRETTLFESQTAPEITARRRPATDALLGASHFVDYPVERASQDPHGQAAHLQLPIRISAAGGVRSAKISPASVSGADSANSCLHVQPASTRIASNGIAWLVQRAASSRARMQHSAPGHCTEARDSSGFTAAESHNCLLEASTRGLIHAVPRRERPLRRRSATPPIRHRWRRQQQRPYRSRTTVISSERRAVAPSRREKLRPGGHAVQHLVGRRQSQFRAGVGDARPRVDVQRPWKGDIATVPT